MANNHNPSGKNQYTDKGQQGSRKSASGNDRSGSASRSSSGESRSAASRDSGSGRSRKKH